MRSMSLVVDLIDLVTKHKTGELRCPATALIISLYLLKLLMDQVDTLYVGRYWSEVLCCTIMTHLGDPEVKVTDLEILC